MVSLDARLAALTGLDAGELLFFTVKLLDLPAEAGRFLHGLGGELSGVVGDHMIRTLGGKRQAEQFQLMPLGDAPWGCPSSGRSCPKAHPRRSRLASPPCGSRPSPRTH